MAQRLNILIIDDHDIIIWAIKRFFEKDFKEASFHSASNFKEGLSILRGNLLNLIILDVDIPDGNTPEMVAEIHKIQPEAPILIYTGLPEKEYSLKYLTAGANGFMSKNSPISEMYGAIQMILSGKRYISALAHEAITERFLLNTSEGQKKKHHFHLTAREKSVIYLLLKGKWTKEIAGELGMKISTVCTHKAHIFEKFDVHNAVELFIKVKAEMPELLVES